MLRKLWRVTPGFVVLLSVSAMCLFTSLFMWPFFPTQFWLPVALSTAFLGWGLCFSCHRKYLNLLQNIHYVYEATSAVNYKLEYKAGEFSPLWVSSNVQKVLGYTTQEALGESWWWSNIYPDDRDMMTIYPDEIVAHENFAHEYRFRLKNGRYVWVKDELHIVQEGTRIFVIGTWSNISEIKETEDDIQLKSTVLNEIYNGVVVFNEDLNIVDINKSCSRFVGQHKDELVGTDIVELVRKFTRDIDVDHIVNVIEESGYWQGSFSTHTLSGNTRFLWMSANSTNSLSGPGKYYYFVVTDITSLKEKESKIDELTRLDPLTGLLNRDSLATAIESRIRSMNKDACFCLIFIGIRRFGIINDNKGYRYGDNVLKGFSRNMRDMFSSPVQLFRFGGGEFVALSPSCSSHDEMMNFIAGINECVQLPVQLDQHSSVLIDTKIGVSVYPTDSREVEELLSFSHLAMDSHVHDQMSGISFYDHQLAEQAGRLFNLEAELAHAVERSEFSISYQPVVSLRESKLVGAEALLRWHNQNLGEVSPGNFVPVAELTGHIHQIGRWVISTVIEQVSLWLAENQDPGIVSINISSRQVEPGLPNFISEQLKRFNVQPHKIELELTETSILSSNYNIGEILEELSQTGVQLALDDFGTGYSSLSYLKLYPFNKVKIDKSFIHDLEASAGSRAMVEAILKMAHELDMQVQAEGVENNNQLEFLTELQCDFYQGYLHARPLALQDFTAHMNNAMRDEAN